MGFIFIISKRGLDCKKFTNVRGCAGSYQSSKKFGIKVKISKMIVEFMEKVLTGTNIKNLIVDAQNSGTLGRLISLLINTPYPIKLIGDKVYLKRL